MNPYWLGVAHFYLAGWIVTFLTLLIAQRKADFLGAFDALKFVLFTLLASSLWPIVAVGCIWSDAH